jgi:peroxiredoxin
MQLEVLADRNGGVMRLLGMDTVGEASVPDGVKCQRFAAVVDNGILLRLVGAGQRHQGRGGSAEGGEGGWRS